MDNAIRSLCVMLSMTRRGFDEGGAPGLLAGACRGLLGALVRPLAYLLETSSHVAESITNAVIGAPEVVPRIRPPRFVSASSPLSTYDESEARARPKTTMLPFHPFFQSCFPPGFNGCRDQESP